MGTPELQSAVGELSAIQRQAVEWDSGPLLVLAGPGSGKTRVLTCRIAGLLDATADQNFRILGLTFTNKAADEMRSRVAGLVPGQESRLFLGTFHSFCADMLRQHGTQIGINPNFNIYAQDVDLQAILDEAVSEAQKLSDLISDQDRRTLQVIQRLKSSLITPENAAEALAHSPLVERIPLVYSLYEEGLTKRNALDFNSLILKAHQLLVTLPALANRYRTVYPYILVDEFQDVNQGQYDFVRALTGDVHKNLLVVADDDQIIYQWNGASHQRLVDFRNDYSPEIIQLPMNYRCPPEIVDLANELIRFNFLRTPDKAPLQAFKPSGGPECLRLLPSFSDFEEEAKGTAGDIGERHKNQFGSVAVLGRSRKLLDAVKEALDSRGIPAVISQRKDEFNTAGLVWLHSTLKLANDRQNEKDLEAVCGSFEQLTGLRVPLGDILTLAQSTNNDFVQAWAQTGTQSNPDPNEQEAIEKISELLGERQDYRQFISFALAWIERLIAEQPGNDESQQMLGRFKEERLVWQSLTKEITDALGTEPTLGAFLQELQMRSKEAPLRPDAVTLMTIHGAKGKEFTHVYLVGLVDDEMPSFQSKQKGDHSPEMEEERRNCFVAITRTMETLTLSCADSYRGWTKEPSRFLYEMGLLAPR